MNVDLCDYFGCKLAGWLGMNKQLSPPTCVFVSDFVLAKILVDIYENHSSLSPLCQAHFISGRILSLTTFENKLKK